MAGPVILRALLACLLSLAALPAWATNYYVKNGGSDANTGLSDAQAWAHHPWMEDATGVADAAATTLTDGDTVFMARGSSWVYTSGLSVAAMVVQSSGTADYITTAAYGTGAKPLIHVNYDTTKRVVYGRTSTTVGYLKFDGLEFRRESAVYSGTSGNVMEFGTNVAADGIVPHHIRVVNCAFSTFPINGLQIFKGHHLYIGDETRLTQATATSFDNEFGPFGYAAIYILGASGEATDEINVYGNYVHDGHADGAGGASFNQYGVNVSNSASLGSPRNIYVRYNYLKNLPSWECFDTHGASEIYFEYNRAVNCSMHFSLATLAAPYNGAVGPVYARFNDAYNEPTFVPTHGAGYMVFNIGSDSGYGAAFDVSYNRTGFTAARTTGTAIKFLTLQGLFTSADVVGNTFDNASGAVGIYQANSNMGPVAISRNRLSAVTIGVQIAFSAVLTQPFVIENNVIEATTSGAVRVSGATIGFDLSILNNTAYMNCGATACSAFFSNSPEAGTGHAPQIKNNVVVFDNQTTDDLYAEWYYTPGAGVEAPVFANNIYFNGKGTAGSLKFVIGGTGYTTANWVAGVEATALEANPLLVGPSSRNFRLTKGSPAIDSGADVGLTVDAAGRVIPYNVTPDRGAYEWWPSGGARLLR